MHSNTKFDIETIQDRYTTNGVPSIVRDTLPQANAIDSPKLVLVTVISNSPSKKHEAGFIFEIYGDVPKISYTY
jgi:hypothetical protein